VDSGVRPIETVRSSVIGLVISAPDADADLLPLNTPKLFFGGPSALRAAIIPTGATEPGTGLDAINMIYGITNPVLIVVRVDGEDLKTSLIGDATLRTGVWALLNAKSLTGIQPRILCAPCADGYTVRLPPHRSPPLCVRLPSACVPSLSSTARMTMPPPPIRPSD
jgi:phage tail sheath protein FI